MTTDRVTITSGALSATISALGAELQTLQDSAGRDLLSDGDPRFWSGRAPILFPVIGELNDGGYTLDGQRYAMAKHGIARTSTFAVIEQAAESVTFALEASDATRAVYPFAFRLEIRFAIVGAVLAVTATIANLGDAPMPASFGFHPALRWPLPYGQPRADHTIRFAHDEPAPIRRIDGAGLLLPNALPTPVEGNTLTLRDDLFAADALIFDRLTSRSVSYGAPTGPRIEVSFTGFPTLGVWTKPGAGFICIEPWQGSADPVGFTGDLRDKPGIIEIAPGSVRNLTMTIALRS